MGMTTFTKRFYCIHCGSEMRQAPARFDGEATYVGYLPCINGCKDPFGNEQRNKI